MASEPDAGGLGDAPASDARRRLASYGSLAPRRANHDQLDGLEGRWSRGHVHGTLVNAGWASGIGYPALILDPNGAAIEVDVFESADLPAHWSRLDQFEGPGYRRVTTTVDTASGHLDAFIYVLEPEARNPVSGTSLRQAKRPPAPPETGGTGKS